MSVEVVESYSDLNIYERLARIRAISDVAKKSKKGYNYTYSDITEILAKVTAGMKKYQVSLIPCIRPGTVNVEKNEIVNTKFDKAGNVHNMTTTEMLFTGEMVFTWVCDDKPEDRIDVSWFITGSMSDPAQAMGSGLTYTLRQFLTSYFQIAQSDQDVDAYRTKQKEAESAEDRTLAEAIIAEFDVLIKSYLADNQDKKDEIKAFIGKYIRGGDYFKIKEPAMASKLIKDFKEMYLSKKGNK